MCVPTFTYCVLDTVYLLGRRRLLYRQIQLSMWRTSVRTCRCFQRRTTWQETSWCLSSNLRYVLFMASLLAFITITSPSVSPEVIGWHTLIRRRFHFFLLPTFSLFILPRSLSLSRSPLPSPPSGDFRCSGPAHPRQSQPDAAVTGARRPVSPEGEVVRHSVQHRGWDVRHTRTYGERRDSPDLANRNRCLLSDNRVPQNESSNWIAMFYLWAPWALTSPLSPGLRPPADIQKEWIERWAGDFELNPELHLPVENKFIGTCVQDAPHIYACVWLLCFSSRIICKKMSFNGSTVGHIITQ